MVAKLAAAAGKTAAPVLAPSPDRDLPGDTVEIPVRLCNLPPLNAIANQVIALSANADLDIGQISTVMEGDPAFAADLLFLANSSLFCLRSRIQTVRHAITVLGLERIKSIAVTAAMRSFLTKGGPSLPRCWRHSAACAIIAEEISPILDVRRDVAYTLGLMHDIGRLGLLKTYPGEYAPVFDNTFQNVEEVLWTERTLLKVDHSQAGAWMVKTWDFPEVFVQICQHHHEPIASSDSGLLQTVKLSCRLAEAIGHSAINFADLAAYDDLIRLLPPHLAHKRFPSGAEMCTTVEARLKSFAC